MLVDPMLCAYSSCTMDSAASLLSLCGTSCLAWLEETQIATSIWKLLNNLQTGK